MLTLEATGARSRRTPPERPAGWPVDWLAVLAVGALVGLGELNLLAIGAGGLALHQLVSVAGGVVLLCLLLRVRAASLSLLGTAVYALTVLLLLAVMVKGRGAYGATRWFSLGIFDLQPSELAKLGVLLLLASVLGTGRAGWRRTAASLLAAAVPIGLTLVQPDLSTASVLVALTLALLLVARAPLPMLAAVTLGGAAIAPLAVRFLRPYQLARLHAFTAGHSTGSS